MDIVKNFYVNKRTDSDHIPLSLKIEEGKHIRKEKERRKEDNREEIPNIQERSKKTCWSKEHKRAYRDKAESIDVELEKEENIEISKRSERGRGKKRQIGYKDWWDKSCTKRKVCSLFKKWKNRKVKREAYIEERRKWEDWMEKKEERKEKRRRILKVDKYSRSLEIHK